MSTEPASLAGAIDVAHRRAEHRLFWWTVVFPVGTLLACLGLLEAFLVVVLT